tara:strand:- start:139 stop:411 length:273 start_codon:yes stop_codon:yes gene_type:complete
MFLGNVSLLESGHFNADIMLIEYDIDLMSQVFHDFNEVEIFDFYTHGRQTYCVLHTYKLRLLQRKFKKYIWQKKFSLQARMFREIHGRWP